MPAGDQPDRPVWTPPDRYQMFLQRTLRERRVWGLGDDLGWVPVKDKRGNQWYPIWPTRETAAACVRGRWHRCQPCAIGLKDFVRLWLPRSSRLGHRFIVHPTPASAGVGVSAYELDQAFKARYRDRASRR